MRILELNDIYAGYDDLKVLYGLSLYIEEGEVVALVGSNGAGKTTLLRIISGFVPVSRGSILYRGEDLLKRKTHERAPLGIAHIPQGRGTLGKLTVMENLILGAYEKKARASMKANIENAFRLFPKLKERQKQIAGSLSGGEQQMLAFGRILMMNPQLIIMDEPSLGLAPIIVEEVFEFIEKISSQMSISVFIVEQNLVQALRVAKRGYVLENGVIAKEGDAKMLLQDPGIVQAYLGL